MADKRAFANLDVGYMQNPKLLAMRDAMQTAYADAVLAHIQSVLYASQHLTDGVVSPRLIIALVDAPDEVEESLVEHGLWHRPEHDCPDCPQPPDKRVYVHNYLEHNRKKADVTDKSDQARKAALKRWADAERNASGNADSNAPVNAKKERKKYNNVAGSDEPDDAPESPKANDREDIRELLDYLDEKILEHDPDARLPHRSKENKDSARLLLDKDGRTIDQVKACIDYAFNNTFWWSNIRSMRKLRDKYDTLRAQAQANGTTAPPAAPQQMPQFDIDGYASDSYRWYEDHDAVAEADHYGKPRPPASDFIIFPGDPATDEHLTGPNRRRVRHRPNTGG